MKITKENLLDFIVDEFSESQKIKLVQDYALGDLLTEMNEIENFSKDSIRDTMNLVLNSHDYRDAYDAFRLDAPFYYWNDHGYLVSVSEKDSEDYYENMIYWELDFLSIDELLEVIEVYCGYYREDLED